MSGKEDPGVCWLNEDCIAGASHEGACRFPSWLTTEQTGDVEKDAGCPDCGLPPDYCACALVFDRPWRVDLSCCGRHFVSEFFGSWQAADEFREAYCTGVAVDPHGYSGDGFSGHQRAGIITDTRFAPPEVGDES